LACGTRCSAWLPGGGTGPAGQNFRGFDHLSGAVLAAHRQRLPGLAKGGAIALMQGLHPVPDHERSAGRCARV